MKDTGVEYYLKEYYNSNKKAKEQDYNQRLIEWANHTVDAECSLMNVEPNIPNKAYCYLMNVGAISDMRPEWNAKFSKVLTVDEYSREIPDTLTMNIDPDTSDFFVMSIGKRFEIEPKFSNNPFIEWELKHDAVARISIGIPDNRLRIVENGNGNIKYLNKFLTKMGVYA